MKRTILSFVTTLLFAGIYAQVAPGKYFIEFRNKNNNPYSIDKPEDFLSARAIQRRAMQWIGYDSTDIPVTPGYVAGIQAMGVTVLTTTKWLNGVIVDLPDTTILDSILDLPYVKGVGKQLSSQQPGQEKSRDKFALESGSLKEIRKDYYSDNMYLTKGYNYGASYTQIHMVNGDLLHQQGYRGQGKVIAVLDAGFQNTDILPVFDSLWLNNQVLGARDFVKPGNNVYQEHPHGTEVLSIMGGNIPGKLIGTSPKASFLLFRTEDTGSEYIIEEYNWISAAEVADSAGADVITSSLGYTKFDDPLQDHTCSDMNGYTTPVARGANTAANKGIIIISSAGNSGGTSWHCVSSPADALGAMGIGAVDSLGHYAGFSSVGEVSTRIKPNVVAMGERTVLATPDGNIQRGSGTSFSAPIIAGMMACLAQAVPTATNYQLIRATELSSSRVSNPDSLVGYGIPDFSRAITLVGTGAKQGSDMSISVAPNPFVTDFTLILHPEKNDLLEIAIFDLSGRSVMPAIGIPVTVGENRVAVKSPLLGRIKPGFYFLQIKEDNRVTTIPLVKSTR